MEPECDQVFTTLSADDNENLPMRIESLCMMCGENGVTQLLCVKIPYYKQVILMSFYCQKCGFANNQLESGEPCQEFGTEIVLKVHDESDLNRQLVKSEYAELQIPELDLVVPSKTQAGEITTVEGVLFRVRKALEQDQNRRWEEEPDTASKIAAFIARIEELMKLEKKFILKIRDPSGNSFLQNPNPYHVDKQCIISHYARSFEDRKLLGLVESSAVEDEPIDEWISYEEAKAEVLRFPTDCHNCKMPVETCMKPTDIPHFSTVIIMCTTCDHCGYRTSDVKSGCAVKDYGCKLSLSVEEEEDLKRDVLKSDTCYLLIPELNFEAGPSTLSGKFTTIEGLLTDARDQLARTNFFAVGDSSTDEDKSKMQDFLSNFNSGLELKKKITVVLDDPAGNSYIQSLVATLNDSRLTKDFYTRSAEQNDELGLNEMKTDGYGELDTINEDEDS